MQGKRLRGMIAAPITPLDKNGALDTGMIKPMVDILVAKGAEGFFAVGSTGNFPLLDSGERKAAGEAFVKAVDGRKPLCLQVGADTESQVLDLARHAGAAGADSIASVPPYYFKYDADALAGFFARVAAVNPELPFYVYNIPMFAANDVTPALLVRLKREIPNLAGVKDTTQDFTRFMEYVDATGRDFDNIMGSDGMCIAALNTGGAGGICAMAAHNPELMAGVFSHWRAGDTETAGRLQFLAARLRQVFLKLPFYTPRVAIMRRRKMLDVYHRPPMRALKAEEEKLLFASLEKLEEEFSFPLLQPV